MLDHYVPDNLLVTALDDRVKQSDFAQAIVKRAESVMSSAYPQFKKREKRYVNGKMLGGFLFLSACSVVLLVFPSEAQQEAKAVAEEKKIIEELKKEIADLVEKEKIPEQKKELAELVEKLKETTTTEETLRELVKKQKEFKLKEQRLTEKKAASEEGLSESEEQELEELKSIVDQLAQQAGKAQSALNKIGKAPSLPALASAGTPPGASNGQTGSNAKPGNRTVPVRR